MQPRPPSRLIFAQPAPTSMPKTIAIIAALLGFTGVALGAFGAHGLKEIVSPAHLDVWKTAVSYQMYHVPLILLLGLQPILNCARTQRIIAILFICGVVIFSGSLYALVALNIPQLGMITPIGGLSLLCGWAILFFGLIKHR
jgi:uncharacterized membrane protein YgdD (TMEM256/DUF423 family)